jgi:hypothetical protein
VSLHLRVLDRGGERLPRFAYRSLSNLPEDGRQVLKLCQLGQVLQLLVAPDQGGDPVPDGLVLQAEAEGVPTRH